MRLPVRDHLAPSRAAIQRNPPLVRRGAGAKALRTTVHSKPVSKVRFSDYLPKRKGMKLDAIEPQEVRELFAELRKEGKSTSAIPPEWHLFFEFLVHTGQRISEMIGLTWEHLELEDKPRVKVREQVAR